MGLLASIRNNFTPGPSVIVEAISTLGPWFTGPYHTGYYARKAIQHPLHRNLKINHRFNHELTGSLLCPAGLDWNDPQTKNNLQSGKLLVCGDQWPVFVYAHHTYDTKDPWCGLLRSHLLVCAYKHVFMSPSSVDREPKATQSGNAHLHGMNSITVRFALSSSLVFSRTNTATNSETFYHSLLNLLENPDEPKEVDELLVWWNRQVFPTSSAAKQPITANSVSKCSPCSNTAQQWRW
ncbi:hypothetical protein BDR05DRAFT_978950 [Suillus weaverae]|nr:hypothetical protein BDR05DRAFT_978950 [Suillus weaverae]